MNSDILISVTMLLFNMAILTALPMGFVSIYREMEMERPTRVVMFIFSSCLFMAVVTETMLWVDMMVSNL